MASKLITIYPAKGVRDGVGQLWLEPWDGYEGELLPPSHAEHVRKVEGNQWAVEVAVPEWFYELAKDGTLRYADGTPIPVPPYPPDRTQDEAIAVLWMEMREVFERWRWG